MAPVNVSLKGENSRPLNDLHVRFDLPGFNEEDVMVTLDRDVLVISQKPDALVEEERALDLGIVAGDQKTRMAFALAARIADSDCPVILKGANGTGKQLFASAIHKLGKRRTLPLTWISCRDDRGATALTDLITSAQEGTLFLDHIDELRDECFTALKTVQQSSELRVIVSLSNELTQALPDNLQGCFIELYPLKDRVDDILPLVRFYTARLSQKLGLAEKDFSPEFLEVLTVYPWPGNVRELINTLEQVLLSSGGKKTLFSKDLPNHIRIEALKRSAKGKIGL